MKVQPNSEKRILDEASKVKTTYDKVNSDRDIPVNNGVEVDGYFVVVFQMGNDVENRSFHELERRRDDLLWLELLRSRPWHTAEGSEDTTLGV